MSTTITLHPVKQGSVRSNRFCGPSALSILTGLDTEDTARLLRSVSGRKSIRGTSAYHMRLALERLGFRVQCVMTSMLDLGTTGRPTFAQWCRRERSPNDTYLLITGHHYVIVQGRRCCCGIMKVPTFISQARKRRARVTEVFKVERVGKQRFTSLVPPKPIKVDYDAKPRAEAKRLAAQYGIEIEREDLGGGIHWYVWPPDGLYVEDSGTDPLEGERVAYCWSEVLSNVRVYVDLIQTRAAAAVSAAPVEVSL